MNDNELAMPDNVTIPRADLDAAIEAMNSITSVLDAELQITDVMSPGEYARLANAHIGLGVVMLAPNFRAALATLKGRRDAS